MQNTQKKQTTFDLKSADDQVRLRIKDIRVTKGVTQAEIANHIGVVHQQYHKYEAGVLRFSASMLIAIAEYLDCPITDLVPQQIGQASPLEPVQRVDLLKQRLQSQIQNCDSEKVLLALTTLLGEETYPQLVVSN